MNSTKTFILASFPKSGNTWVNFTIANMYNQLTGRFPEIDFHNIHDINPELPPNGSESTETVFMHFPRVFTTHSMFRESFENTILVIRNPWDVLYSYYHYLKGEHSKDLSLSEVILHENYGIRSLVAHNESFIRDCKNLVVITYEQMQENPEKEARRIADFLELEIVNKSIRRAVNESSFNSMRQIEVCKGRKYGTPGFMFTRSGKVGEGKEALKADVEMDNLIFKEVKKSPLLYRLYGP